MDRNIFRTEFQKIINQEDELALGKVKLIQRFVIEMEDGKDGRFLALLTYYEILKRQFIEYQNRHDETD
jgi:hypothetical protein